MAENIRLRYIQRTLNGPQKKSSKNFWIHFANSIHPPTFALQIKKRKFKVL